MTRRERRIRRRRFEQLIAMTPRSRALPQLPRISDYVEHYAEVTPGADALALDGLRIDYEELWRRVRRLARALLAAGVGKGDRVATLATPSPDYFVAFLSTATIGGIWVGLNPRYQLAELTHAATEAAPSVLLTRTLIDGRDYSGDIAALKASTPSLRHIVTLGADPVCAEAEPLADFLRKGDGVDERSFETARGDCVADDPCMIVFTSGSTGRPKGAVLHHRGIVTFSIGQNRHWPLSSNRVLNYLPINHVGCVVDISTPTLVDGGCIVFMEDFDPETALQLMERERISVWASVPSVFLMQLGLPSLRGYDLSAVELIVWEGAAMPIEAIRRLLAFGKPLATNYGMTETTSAITIVDPTRDEDRLANSVGTPFHGVEVRLVTADGTVAAPGEVGELQARSILNMHGYWGRPEETAATILPDGWLRTGDLAVERPDGTYQIVGRLKEMFKSGGYNVYPREVENVLEAHPQVALAAVVPVHDDVWQEVGVAFVQRRNAVSEAELERHCRAHLANYKIPKKFVIMSELPLLPIGKVDKNALQQLAEQDSEVSQKPLGAPQLTE